MMALVMETLLLQSCHHSIPSIDLFSVSMVFSSHPCICSVF
ncbi:hypothetical protein Goari_005060 [Gossypium aridum]|uniref:Uncharacterized protein n=1 Tax=Gossypium aridum TaxID=34290 RepID=A0A7J8Y5F9_GOSAI|nr:hypothetical protein [Gossypium aridum]